MRPRYARSHSSETHDRGKLMNASPQILALADDLTGALEVGARLSGLGSVVTTSSDSLPDLATKAVIIDTETRHLEPSQAHARVHYIAQAAQRLQIELIYKKTDSTLRGNIGPELHALARAFPERPIAFVPGFPQLGRTVRQGVLHVNDEPVHKTAFSQDALNPILTSFVPDLFTKYELPVTLHELAASHLEKGTVHIFDVETEAEVASVAQLLLNMSPLPIFCGPANLASHLTTSAESQSVQTLALPVVHNCLVVNGSRHELSAQQIAYAQTHEWETRSAEELLDCPPVSDWTILETEPPPDYTAQESAARTGRIVRDLAQKTRLDCLIVFGGDTAYGIVQALGESTLIPICELLPGVPLSRMGDLQLVTKAGGFGPVDLLLKIRELLSGGR